MWAVFAAYVLLLATHGDGYSLLVDGWLSSVATWMTAFVCWAALFRLRLWNVQSVAATLAVTSFALGDQYYVLAAGDGGDLPVPSLADVGYLGVYPLLVLALAALIRRRAARWVPSTLLDAAVGALGAAAVLAVVLDPIFGSGAEDPFSAAALVSAAYPLLDLVLIAAVVGMAAAPGLRLGRSGGALVAGLFVFAVCDVAYALLVAAESYAMGTVLDAGWILGLALIAVWVEHPSPEAVTGTVSDSESVSETVSETVTETGTAAKRSRARPLTVATAATLAGLGILTRGAFTEVPAPALLLSCFTLVLAAVRTQLAFRALASMAEVRVQSRTDDLTGLSNRRAFHGDVPRKIGRAAHGAILILDLDKFKEVNDGLGHEHGDTLLAEVSRRLSRHVRAPDVLARIGGDEFAVCLAGADLGRATALAAELGSAIAEPVTLEGITLRPEVSIGIALWPAEGTDLGVLMRHADVAMYRAKSQRSGHHVYSAADDTHGADRLRDLEELRLAIGLGQLVPYYQPKLQMATGGIAGVEVLVRWNHPSRGVLHPGEFLPLLDEAGLMPRMTDWVLAEALDQSRLWSDEGRTLALAVNISASSLADDTLPDRVADMLAARGLAPGTLTLEITEDFLVTDPERARLILLRLRLQGVRISIDDFGTGYSSLAYLRDLPIDELKLDKSFIATLGDDQRASTLVQSTITLAHGLGLRMVAEGVEDQAAFMELERRGCDEVQGYFICRPLSAADLGPWLDHRAAAGSGIGGMAGSGVGGSGIGNSLPADPPVDTPAGRH